MGPPQGLDKVQGCYELNCVARRRWTGEIPVSGMGAEFKFCVIDDKGTILEWEHGDNRVVDSDEVSTAFRAPPPEEEAVSEGGRNK